MLQNDLTTIKNAYLAKKAEVTLPYSRITLNVLNVLKRRAYVGEVGVFQRESRSEIVVTLSYTQGIPHLHEVKFLSKPGRRLYSKSSALRPARQGFADIIISTSKGIMTAQEAKKQGLGGEVICEVF